MSASTPFAEVNVGPNRVSLLRDGAQAYPAMLEAISAARSTLCVETYIFREDRTGLRFAEALMARARAGVEVNLIYDGWGSSVSTELRDRLRAAGVRVVEFGPIRLHSRYLVRLARVFARLRRRNHRKALIADGRVGFTGGLNLSDDYASEAAGGSGWRDTHVRLEGPAAVELEKVFLDTWRRSRGPAIDLARYRRPFPMSAAAPEASKVRIVCNTFLRERKDIRRAYVTAIQGARRQIHLTHAYFLPPVKVLRALQHSARRGVEVSVILAATTDVPLVRMAARAIYGRLLRAGVRVFEWRGRVLHAKTAVVDGNWATVGSANLDYLSLRENLEVNAVVEDAEFGQAVEAMFNQDLYSCE
jgi:cardiolipin synthase